MQIQFDVLLFKFLHTQQLIPLLSSKLCDNFAVCIVDAACAFRIYCIPKAYIAVVRNHFFGNYSGKPDQIATRFYKETSRGTRACKHSAPSFKRAQNVGENNAFCEVFVTKTTHRFTQFPVADFREIQNPKTRVRVFILLEEKCEFFLPPLTTVRPYIVSSAT